MMAKMSNTMIALCTAAIGAVYATGYVATLPTEAQSTATQSHRERIQIQQPSSTINEEATPSAPQQTTSSTYKDGTYYGEGMNRIGSVQVAVTIKGDKITAVDITNCDTHYSQSYIDDLPNQVVASQSSDVDVVSGATLSTEDFQTAVDNALQQAMNS